MSTTQIISYNATSLNKTLEFIFDKKLEKNEELTEFWFEIMKNFDKGTFYENFSSEFINDFKLTFNCFINNMFEKGLFSSLYDVECFKDDLFVYINKMVGFESESFENFIDSI